MKILLESFQNINQIAFTHFNKRVMRSKNEKDQEIRTCMKSETRVLQLAMFGNFGSFVVKYFVAFCPLF